MLILEISQADLGKHIIIFNFPILVHYYLFYYVLPLNSISISNLIPLQILTFYISYYLFLHSILSYHYHFILFYYYQHIFNIFKPIQFHILQLLKQFIKIPMFTKLFQTSYYFLKYKPIKHKTLSLLLTTYYANQYIFSKKLNTITFKQSQIPIIIQDKQHKQISKWTYWKNRLGYLIWQIVRFFHLIYIFSPSFLLLPLKLYSKTQQLWLDIFVNCIQRAGVVWIKTFQYLSHRRDIIGQKMANKFIKLRQGAPQHTFKQTNQNFKKQFGMNITQMFQKINPIPIASGSVSQVYQAIYKGQKVAVKVRHPGVQKYISRDLDLLFFISRFLSKFSGRYQIPVSEDSLKKTLTQQIDFNIEARNLKIFNQMFKNSSKVKFPIAFQQSSTSSVLIQTFIEGTPITYYQSNKHQLNKVIAMIGATTFFEMLMKNNFIHADCHGGNIMVTIKEKSQGFFVDIKDKFQQIYNYFENQFLKNVTFTSDIFKQLYIQSKKQAEIIRKIQKEQNKKVEVTLIDVGMVIKLDETDRLNFINFIKSVIERQPEQCANMIYSLSLFSGKKIMTPGQQKKYIEYYNDLYKLFSVLKNQKLKELDGIKLFRGMLDLIRQYQMKLDGQFATLLTNMLVLQAIAKDLNPQISILKCAIPYFKVN